MNKLTFAFASLLAVGCSKKTENKAEPAPKMATENKDKAPEPASKTMTVTTKSPEAKAAYDHGESLMIVARGSEAVPDFKKAIELDPDFAMAHAMLGVVTPGAEGMAELDKATGLAAKLPEAERLFIDGFRQLRSGQQAAAVETWKKVTELAPDDFRPAFQVGNIANMTGDATTGLAMFQKLQQLKPDLAIVQNGLAYSNAGLKQWDAAIAAAKKQTELLPKEPNPQDTLGEILLMAGKYDESEKAFQQAVTMEPKFTVAWQGVALARAYRGDWKGAAEANEKRRATSESINDKVEATLDMAWLAAAAGKPADGFALLDGLDKDPANAKAAPYAAIATDRGMLLQLTGKYDESAKAYAEGVKRAETAPGMIKNNAARTQAIGLLRIAALTGKAAPDADKLVAVTAQDMDSPFRKSLNAWAKGLALWAKSGAKDAVAELAKCDPNVLPCRLDLANAQRKAGDAAGAAATEKQIMETNMRDAVGVYVHTVAAKKK